MYTMYINIVLHVYYHQHNSHNTSTPSAATATLAFAVYIPITLPPNIDHLDSSCSWLNMGIIALGKSEYAMASGGK